MTKVERNQGDFVLLLFISLYCVLQIHSAKIAGNAGPQCLTETSYKSMSRNAAILTAVLAISIASARTQGIQDMRGSG
jgi:hypothetical protein